METTSLAHSQCIWRVIPSHSSHSPASAPFRKISVSNSRLWFSVVSGRQCFAQAVLPREANCSSYSDRVAFFMPNLAAHTALGADAAMGTRLPRSSSDEAYLELPTDNEGPGNDDGNRNSGNNGDGGGPGFGEGPADGEERKNAWNTYLMLLDRHPILTKSVTAGLMNLVADLICQLAIEHSGKFHIQRLIGFTCIGFFVVGPSLHIWYGTLLALFPIQGNLGTIIRLCLDQFIFSPISIAIFFAVLLSFEGRQDQVVPKMKKDLLPTIIAQWKLWIPFQFINFRFVPASLQVASASMIGLVWTVYMSYVTHKDIPWDNGATGVPLAS